MIDLAPKYHGKACHRCGGTERYKSNWHCVYCKRTAEQSRRGERAARNARRSERRLKEKAPISLMYREEIASIYKDAELKTVMMGIPHEVDHDIPVNHPHVCGLHVPWNLQVLTKPANLEKSNKFDPREHERSYGELPLQTAT